MRFGEVLNRYRERANLSINQLGRYADITPTYISRMQNSPDKLPSQKVLFKIASVLNVNEEAHDPIYLLELFESYAEGKGLTEKELKKLTLEFNEYINEQVRRKKDKYSVVKDLIYKNLVVLDTDDVRSLSSINYLSNAEVLSNISKEPVFDLKWLLNQKKYSVLYGRDISFTDEKDIFYNVIPKDDLKMISKIIETYLSTKYSVQKDSRAYFEHQFSEFLDDSITDIMNGEDSD